MSNRAIAERLTLSVRTVESHVLRAMGKTGTTSREELAALVTKPFAAKCSSALLQMSGLIRATIYSQSCNGIAGER